MPCQLAGRGHFSAARERRSRAAERLASGSRDAARPSAPHATGAYVLSIYVLASMTRYR